MRMFRWLSLPLVALLLGGVLASCGKDDTKSTAAPTEVSVALDWYPWANHTGLYMANSKGYFADEGLKVNLYTPADPSTGLQLVASGKDTFTISYQTDLLLARGVGLGVKSVAAFVQHPLNTLMTLQSSGITKPSQLKGKKIGVAGVSSDEPLLSTMLAADGLTLNDVEVVNVGFDLMPALLGGTVDGVLGAYAVNEAFLAAQQGKPVNVMNIQDWGVPDYYELLLVASDSTLKDNPAVVEKFLRAMAKGYADAAKDQSAALDELVKAAPDTDRAVETQSLQQVVPLWTDSGKVAFGTQTTERWTAYTDWMRQNNILTKDVAVNDAFTNEFVAKISK
jgi:putative hydroxymethylpyrimidine transport system substrate-binding protein